MTANGVTGSYVDIISQIVYNEMSSTMHPEAMKAQAIAAYTYIMFNGGSVNNVILKPNPAAECDRCSFRSRRTGTVL